MANNEIPNGESSIPENRETAERQVELCPNECLYNQERESRIGFLRRSASHRG